MLKRLYLQVIPCLITFLLLVGTIFTAAAQVTNFYLRAGMDAAEDRWVDSVFNALDTDEKLGQLFMIRAHSDLGPDHIAKVEAQIKKYKVGSLCFFQGTPEKQAELINRYQGLSSTLPLMIAIDGEWGLGMRMPASTISFPRQLTLGAIQDNDLIYQMGREVGQQLKRAGIHVNFAPVVDINNNAANPVINNRSFGEDRYNVTIKSYQYMKGMQDEGIMACAKHFPGHGDTDVDSHYDLPVINHDLDRLDSIEFYPFELLSKEGVGSMMIAHLNVPALDQRANRPTTLSRNTVTNLLREQMRFQGLAFTDALEMKGVTKYFEAGEVEAEALLAGNDVLVLPEDIGAAMRTIKAYIQDGKLDQNQVDASVKRMLRSKYRLQLTNFTPIQVDNIRKDLNNKDALVLKSELVKAALTLVRNQKKLLPFTQTTQLSMASLSIGAVKKTAFQTRIDAYQKMEHYQLNKNSKAAKRNELAQQLAQKDVVLVSLHDMSKYASRNFGLQQADLDFLYQLNRQTKVVLNIFGSPYSLKYFDRFEWVLCAYDEDTLTQDLTAQALFGAFSIQGRLPVTASKRSTYNSGHITPKAFRMGYSLPEATGLNSDTLQKIDAIIKEAIDIKATPGCVVLVAKNGQIVFEKAYGHHTYAKQRAVQTADIYDLASITKVAAATLAVMHLQDSEQIDIQQPINNFIPELNATNKNGKTVKDIMAHHAGLIGWIPFYKQTVSKSRRNPQPLKDFYRSKPEEAYSIQVADNLYLRKDFRDSIWQQIYHSDLRSSTDYRYSDLGFYLMAQLVERQSGMSLDRYMNQHFYQPMGLQNTSYLPLQKFNRDRIVPTERDNYFRRRTVHGHVHDMGAAMLGGISGHAGLFSNASDLAQLMQMLLQGGYYGGEQYLKPETIENFTMRHPRSSRRGIGFDLKELNPNHTANLANEASPNTFGHLGFTGTAVWTDPDEDLIYIFLSNRTYPSMNNSKLHKLDFRPRIQSVIYRALESRTNYSSMQTGS
ncbi:MAG: glycoside hydrolase family 3 N-terminal domain-containing protein [Saprospiraceae bacterium]